MLMMHSLHRCSSDWCICSSWKYIFMVVSKTRCWSLHRYLRRFRKSPAVMSIKVSMILCRQDSITSIVSLTSLPHFFFFHLLLILEQNFRHLIDVILADVFVKVDEKERVDYRLAGELPEAGEVLHIKGFSRIISMALTSDKRVICLMSMAAITIRAGLAPTPAFWLLRFKPYRSLYTSQE